MKTRRTGRGWQGWKDDVATTTLEYALLLALVVMTSIASYQALGRSTAQSTSGSNGEIAAATEAGESSSVPETGAPAAPSGG